MSISAQAARACLIFSAAILSADVAPAQERAAAPQPGASPSVIRLGMSTALAGPSGQLGQGVRAGVLAAIEERNRAGGVQGRTIELLALDDGYEPRLTAPNMRQLVEKDNVLAIVGNVGTPTAVAALPIVAETKVPFFGAFTGAGNLRRSPPDRYVINYRASYAEETGAMVDALIDVGALKLEEMAFFTQRDAYGDAGYSGGVAALKRRGLKDESQIAHGRFERNTLAVENGLADILAAGVRPRAVIMVGAYAPCAAFIRTGRESGLDAVYLNVSFVGADSLLKELNGAGDGVIITQVVPPPASSAPIVREYHAAMERSSGSHDVTFMSLEGYVLMRVFLRALDAKDVELSREGVVRALESLGEFDIGLGAPLKLSSQEHQACHRVWPTVIRGGKIVPFEWSELGSLGKRP